MISLARVLAPRLTARAHCDITCGIYDPIAATIAPTWFGAPDRLM